jgi:hypothetical protein
MDALFFALRWAALIATLVFLALFLWDCRAGVCSENDPVVMGHVVGATAAFGVAVILWVARGLSALIRWLRGRNTTDAWSTCEDGTRVRDTEPHVRNR